MSSYREQSNEAKAKRRGIVEQRPVSGKSKKDRPFVVEERIRPGHVLAVAFPGWAEWRKSGEYRSLSAAQSVITQKSRKHQFMEYRMKGES